MNSQIIKSTLAAATLAVGAVVTSGASAEAMDSTLVRAPAVPSTVVSYKRSELASAEGLAAVERRLRHAAESVCGSTDLRIAGSLSRVAERQECANRAVDHAMSQIGANQVASVD